MEVNGYKIEPGANLAHAGLWRANLSNADLTGADLGGGDRAVLSLRLRHLRRRATF
ncbi:MAG: pentapeptide repeat-containing protein [Betaproteobacteria bacterium]